MKKLLIFSLLALSLAIFNSCGSNSDDDGGKKTGTELCLAICEADDCNNTGNPLTECKTACTADPIVTCKANCDIYLQDSTQNAECKADCEIVNPCDTKKETECTDTYETFGNCLLDCFESKDSCMASANCYNEVCLNEINAIENCESNVVCE